MTSAISLSLASVKVRAFKPAMVGKHMDAEHAVGVHVPHPLVHVEAAGPQLGVGARVEAPLLRGPAHGGGHAEGRARLLALEDPLVDAVLVAHHLGRLVQPLLRHVVLVHVGRLDHVVVDADQDHVVEVHGVLLSCADACSACERTDRRAHRQRLPAPHRRGAGPLGLVVVDLPLGEALQHLVERDAALEAGQRRAEAEVDAVAEGLVPADRRGGCRSCRRRGSGARPGWPSRSAAP